jgi:hypothetical protein
MTSTFTIDPQLPELIATASTDSLKEALRLLSLHRASILQAQFTQTYGFNIQAGLFQGMKYLPNCAEGCYIAKLIGCYEAELEPYFRAAIQRPYQVVVNVGCSEGFYAVGLAMLMPTVQVFAYDTNLAAHEDCRQLAAQNGVSDRVSINGLFQPADFQQFADRKTLVLCDIEGGEEELLNPIAAQALQQMDIIVELHDGFAPNIMEVITDRFQATHDISIVHGQLRDITLPPLVAEWGSTDQLLAISEWRAFPTPWAVMIAKS